MNISTNPEEWPGWSEYKAHLMQASYHHADDSGGEWGHAKERIRQAARIAVNEGWRFWMIEQAHRRIKPLVAFDQIMQAVFDVFESRIADLKRAVDDARRDPTTY